jgi:hypothetical protein
MAYGDAGTWQLTGGISVLVIAGFVVQWWVLPGTLLFCFGVLVLCLVTIEQGL